MIIEQGAPVLLLSLKNTPILILHSFLLKRQWKTQLKKNKKKLTNKHFKKYSLGVKNVILNSNAQCFLKFFVSFFIFEINSLMFA